MADLILLYAGAAIPFIWGAAHLFPTQSVVKGFGDISADNKNIITMEWIIEGIALIFIGILAAAVTAVDHQSAVSRTVYILTAVCLIVLAIISLFTGYKVSFPLFKLCPFIFTLSAILIFIGGIT